MWKPPPASRARSDGMAPPSVAHALGGGWGSHAGSVARATPQAGTIHVHNCRPVGSTLQGGLAEASAAWPEHSHSKAVALNG
eukprot:scaffold3394_cov385-Prasinococcus_capsulatus_cf.AAC.5